MKRQILACILMVLAGSSLLFAQQTSDVENLGVQRYGLFVGENNGGSSRQTLRWAVSDAHKLSEVMTEVGGILPGDSLVLDDPGVRAIENGFNRINRLISEEGSDARRVEFVFYYSGHSDEGGLLLGDEHLSYNDLKSRIQGINADVRIAILDSCASGAFTRSKGGERTQPFLVGDNSDMSGHAYLTSSSEDELSQESDRIAASYFTYYFISALRGAADHSGDRRVTLNEAYEYAFNETLAVTSSSLSGPQHPSYNIELSGSGDLVLSDLTNPISSVILDAAMAGRVFIKDGRGNIIVEVNKAEDKIIEIALDPGIYSIQLNSPDGGYYEYQFNLPYRSQKLLGYGDLASIDPQVNRTRGGEPIDPFIDPDNPEGAAADQTSDTSDEGKDSSAVSGSAEDDFFGDTSGFFDDEQDFFTDEGDFFGDTPANRSSSSAATRDSGEVSIEIAPNDEGSAADSVGDTSDAREIANASGNPEAATVVLQREQPSEVGRREDYVYVPFYAELLPGLGYPFGNSSRMINNVAASPLILNSGSIYGAMLTGIMGSAQGPVVGAAFAGAGLEMRDDLYGAAVSGVYNINRGGVYGSQVAGVFNIASEQSIAVQVAGVFNIAEEPVSGGQISGVFNSADYRVDGVQIAGVYNVTGTINGAQVSGVANTAGQFNGAQVSGVVNTTKNGNGAQIGVVNIASGRMNGLQVGVVNIADDLYGLPIGLFSWVRQGIHDISFWGEDSSAQFLGFANGSRNFYTTFYAGIDKGAGFEDLNNLTVGLGWGARFKFKPFYGDLEFSVRRGTEGSTANERMVSIFDPANLYVYPSARLMTGVEIIGIGFFMGVSVDLEADPSLTGGLTRYNGSGSGTLPIEGIGTLHHRFIWGVRL